MSSGVDTSIACGSCTSSLMVAVGSVGQATSSRSDSSRRRSSPSSARRTDQVLGDVGPEHFDVEPRVAADQGSNVHVTHFSPCSAAQLRWWFFIARPTPLCGDPGRIPVTWLCSASSPSKRARSRSEAPSEGPSQGARHIPSPACPIARSNSTPTRGITDPHTCWNMVAIERRLLGRLRRQPDLKRLVVH